MATIIFKGWKVGMRGIPFIHLLNEKANLSLKSAKDLKEGIVDGNTIKIEGLGESLASDILTEARTLGVICEIIPD